MTSTVARKGEMPGGPEPINLDRQIVDYHLDAVPAAGSRFVAVVYWALG